MHHDKNTSIKFVAEFVGEERETASTAAPVSCLCVPQNLELLESKCCGPESMRPQQTRARLRAVRLALHQYSHHHRLLLWIDLVNLIECALDASTDVLGGTNTGRSHRTQRISALVISTANTVESIARAHAPAATRHQI
jgi:hypothetical protein